MDLVSISPATKTVALGNAAVEVSGLSLRKLALLFRDHPDLLGLVNGGSINAATMLASGPGTALAIFTMGVVGPAKPPKFDFGGIGWARRYNGPLDDDALVAAFDAAPAGQQFDILVAIADLTFRAERGTPFLSSVIAALASESQKSEAQQESAPPTPEPSMPTSSSD